MKRFLMGLLVGLCIGLPVSVMADSLVGKKIETEVAVKLDGEYLEVNAIGLEGRTYAPVRALAEALGKDVDWDGEVIITTPVESVLEDSEEMDVMPNNESSDYIEVLEASITAKKNALSTLEYLLEIDISNGADENVIQRQQEDILKLKNEIAELEQKLADLQQVEQTE